MMSNEELRRMARETAEGKVAFYIHFSIYALVNSFLVGLWWWTGGPGIFPWFVFPLFGWGIGVVVHGFAAFRGSSFVQRQTEEEYRRLKRQQEVGVPAS